MVATRRTFLRSTAATAASFALSRHHLAAASAAAFSVSGVRIPSDAWPWWRGPRFDNIVPSANPPLNWSATKNIQWKTPVPGRGHASPILWGDQILVPTADEDRQILQMLSFDRSMGRRLWSAEIHRGGFMKKSEKNSHASATPACDGQRIFFPALYDDALWLSAITFAGDLLWQKRIGGFIPSNGYASSPLIYKNAIIVASDNTGEPCLAALERGTGSLLWRSERPKADNFCSPTLALVAGRPQLVLCGAHMIASYNPENGELIWHVESPTEVTACTPAFGDNFVFAGGNVPVRESICVRADGQGNVTKTHVLWRSRKNVTYVPSPLLHEGLLYMINDGGIAHCIDASSGDEIYKERIGGDFSSSPLVVGNNIFVTNEKGETTVLRLGKKFEVLTRNLLNEAVFATPVFIGSNIFFRTAQHLICVIEKNPA